MHDIRENQFADFEPPAGLLDKVMARIRAEELISIKRRVILFSSGMILSAGASAVFIKTFWTEFARSDFYQFASLFFSDLESASAMWQDLVLAMLESLPSMSIMLILAAAFVFLWSFKRLAFSIGAFIRPPRIIIN